ncbi:DUF1760-domain-containing protein [Lepidopterella palustris CBS 459.81]|uniref:DUF1760-domain-containing protein n=1 Tax=Lepidopterella palustris CBS 459.81 TaxID=1314670 RepID=A0A8E2E7N2_9PEZI|nr:DUF1760-domain-containing protein [Lepidopterella palustris CBS 459.81]
MSDKEQNPLLAALPPVTDYITYLTIIEYNLTKDNLEILHQVLQDTKLTVNIGWDLVQLLLPLLPESQSCLEDIAVRGNPREVILKVTEALRMLEFDEPQADSEADEDEALAEALRESAIGGQPTELGESSTSRTVQSPVKMPLPLLQFEALLSLLPILHQRVKTKYPSRFLSTTLQAVLVCYSKAETHIDELTLAVVKFAKTLSGTKRPHLPPRVSGGNILKVSSKNPEPDPEAQNEPPSDEESTLTNRLLQSFITHILEDYNLSLSSSQDVPGLAWSSRLMENLQPAKVVPGKPTFADKFANEEYLQGRSSTVGQLVAIAQDLGLNSWDLLQTVIDSHVEEAGLPGEESDPPASAQDIPLSKTGSLFLFTARKISEVLFNTARTDITVSIFPEHSAILTNFVGRNGLSSIGTESEALLDAILCLGLLALEENQIGEPLDDEQFNRYLQTTSLISANTSSPALRYHAHYLTSTILRSHPSDVVRLSFIRDTLEHCPYENLKASAVGWLKGEILEANMPVLRATQTGDMTAPEHSPSDDPLSIFATPVALSTVSPYLFPDLTHEWTVSGGLVESWMQFRNELGFFLAALNFYYLLLRAKPLHEILDIAGLHEGNNIRGSYMHPLWQVASRFRENLEKGGELWEMEGEEGGKAGLMDLMILEDVLDRVTEGVTKLNSA